MPESMNADPSKTPPMARIIDAPSVRLQKKVSNMRRRCGCLSAVLLTVGACDNTLPPPLENVAAFVDVAMKRGLDFRTSYGTTFPGLGVLNGLFQDNMGNGAAVGDYDNDGDFDIYLLGQNGHPNQLFRNDLETGNKGFTNVTESAGVGDSGMSRVAHFVDLDNDGNLDLVLVNDDEPSGAFPTSRIYRGNGDGTFADVTEGSNFRPVGYIRAGCSLADYDGDGLLDIYITVWTGELGEGEGQFPGSNRLYKNHGNFIFEDVSETIGPTPLLRDSFTAIFTDFDGNRTPDLYVAIDHTSDEFFWNNGGSFSFGSGDVFPPYGGLGLGHRGNDMGIACADIDDDGDLDLYATNITDPSGILGTDTYNVLQINQLDSLGMVQFVDEALERNVADTAWGWGTEFTDFDNDGDLDLVAVNGMDGYVVFTGGPLSPIYRTPSVLFVNDGSANFSRMEGTGLDVPADSRALVAFDYDRDGDEDLLITNINQPTQLFENTNANGNHWLCVALTQKPGLNRNGIGATVFATINGVTKRREILAGESYLAGTPAEAHFGLAAETTVDELRVRWTDGSETVLTDVSADQRLRVTQE